MRIKAHTRQVIEVALEDATAEIYRLRQERNSLACSVDEYNRRIDELVAQRDQLQADIDWDKSFDGPMPVFLPGMNPVLARSMARLLGYKGVAEL